MINWQQFGLRGNPYDTLALTEGGPFPLESAFVGRARERQHLDQLLGSEDRAALAVCGGVGVGKTSLANYEKYVWKKKGKHALFSFRREIEASEQVLDKRSFLIEIIASVIREIRLIDPELVTRDPLRKLDQLIDLTQSAAFSASLNVGIEGFGGGIGFGRDTSFKQPILVPVATLEGYFRDLLSFVMSHTIGGAKYRGLIVHMNNFDILLREDRGKERAIRFFEEVRDILQTRGVYFLFLGPVNFYQEVLTASQRVRSIFAPVPLDVLPLTKKEVVEAFEERMTLMQSPDVQSYIKPVQDEVVFRLYDLYEGDIRSIMMALCDLLGQFSEMLGKQLSLDEALSLLGRERWTRIESFGFRSEQRRVLRYIVTHGDEINQRGIVSALGKQASNVSSYYVRPLLQKGILEEKRREGRTIYYGLTTEYEPLRWFIESRQRLSLSVSEMTEEQRSLFE